MNEQPATSYSITENLQSKSNLTPKPNLPPKPRFRADQPKLKVAPRPGEAKQSNPALLAYNSNSNLNKILTTTNPSNASSSTESLSLNQSSKTISSSENIISLSVQERSVNLNNLVADEKKPDSHDGISHQSEKDAPIPHEQSASTNFSAQMQNSNSQEINSTENNSFEALLSNIRNDSQSVPDFSPISIPPPPFKARQFKYPSGNLTGTCDFPDFDKKLDEMLRLSQAPRLRKY